MTRVALRWMVAGLVLAAPSCSGLQAPKPTAVPAAAQAVKPSVPPTAPTPKPGKISRLPLEALFQLQQTNAALIYDVRPAFFFNLGHIPGASSWPKSKYAAQLASRETELRAAAAAKRPIVFYCTDLACPDAAAIATRLAARGHSLAILDGGFEAWKTSGLPTE